MTTYVVYKSVHVFHRLFKPYIEFQGSRFDSLSQMYHNYSFSQKRKDGYMAKLNTPLPLRVIAFRSCTSYLSTSTTWPCSNARTSRPTSARSRTEIFDTTSALVWHSPIKKMHFCLDFFRREKEGLGGVSCNVKREQEFNRFQGSGI